MNKIYKVVESEVKKLGERQYEFTASNASEDRDGEVIDPKGWDLKNYKKNPVIMYGHDYHSLPIGRASRVWVSNGSLKNVVEFPPEGTYEFADTVARLVDAGYLKTQSVGFIPKEWEDAEGEKSPRRTYKKQELLEISIVPVPSNPDALRNAVNDGVITTKEFKSLTEPDESETGNDGDVVTVDNHETTTKTSVEEFLDEMDFAEALIKRLDMDDSHKSLAMGYINEIYRRITGDDIPVQIEKTINTMEDEMDIKELKELLSPITESIGKLTEKVEGVEEKFAELEKVDETKRFVPKETHVEVTLDEGDRPFKSLGEQAKAIKEFYTSNGMQVDPRLKITGAGEAVPSDGGFLVQTDFSNQLIQNMFNSSDLLSRVNKMSLSSGANSIKIPAVSDQNRADGYRHGGILAYWSGEGKQKTASQPKFDQVALELKKLVGLSYVTDELLQDVSFLSGWLDAAFRDEFAFKILDAVINGDGAAKPLGILNAPNLVTVTAETGQGASTIVADNVIKIWASRVSNRSGNYVWLINQNIEPQLHTMAIAVGTGGIPVYMPAGGLADAPYGRLMGRPVIPCEHAASLGTAGDIILADLSRYIMIDKGDIQSASSIHLKFDYDETCFRWVYRVDGQPMDKTYITPYKGTTSYQSPFVVLSGTRT